MKSVTKRPMSGSSCTGQEEEAQPGDDEPGHEAARVCPRASPLASASGDSPAAGGRRTCGG